MVYYDALSCTTSTQDTTWTYWVSTDTSSSLTATADPIWISWTSDTTTTATATITPTLVDEALSARRVVMPFKTPEQIKRFQGYVEEQQRRTEQIRRDTEQIKREGRRKSRVVGLRSHKLLRTMLSHEQWLQLKHRGFFDVVVPSGNRYQIHNHGTAGNVVAVDFGKAVRQGKIKPKGQFKETGQKICAHPKLYDGNGHLPQADVMLAQLLALKHGEEAFLKIANLH